MIVKEIKTYQDPYQSIDIELGGEAYTLELRWNDSHKFWVADLYDREEQPIITGVKLVKNYPLIHRYAKSTLPIYGDIAIVSSNNIQGEPALDNMGTTFKLLYIDWTDDELAGNIELMQQVIDGSIWDMGNSIWDSVSARWVE